MAKKKTKKRSYTLKPAAKKLKAHRAKKRRAAPTSRTARSGSPNFSGGGGRPKPPKRKPAKKKIKYARVQSGPGTPQGSKDSKTASPGFQGRKNFRAGGGRPR